MSKISYIVTAILIVVGGVFAVLYNYVWAGFAYFMLGTLAVLALFWAVWLIVQFYTSYKTELEERFKVYRAETINKSKMTSEQFEQDEAAFRLEFNKSVKREKIMKWVYIVFAFACCVMFALSALWFEV